MSTTAPTLDAAPDVAPDAAAPGIRRILVVIGHPIADSLNHAFAASYVDAARDAGAEVRIHDLARIRLPHPETRDELRARDGDTSALDPEIQRLTADLRWAEHVTVFFPQWWGTYPGALSSYLDRVFLSGVAFRYRTGQIPTRLLTGRTARILMTADGPGWWNRMSYRNAAETSLARATFAYCGMRTRGITRFMRVRFSSPARRESWLRDAARVGRRDAR